MLLVQSNEPKLQRGVKDEGHGGLTEPPSASGGCSHFNIGKDTLGHGRSVNDSLKFLVVAHRLRMHVLMGTSSYFNLVVH
jgi:hypothetical protein